ncbi:MAG: bifunctional DNA-formamidopyrimidine glycosylase/DNA-(apurinic or apyrimidinic site) lyase [Zoogloeaceae bacterium]|nr:bifunctional DNA-formamidopyrimidine glycosylase/DNA-(apurinic or apyrimidinic site) lyase [Zoogloeaceae bacterium]MCK6383122.1 bifunctional DNA-formamidopyrimidine glycosylase/DNA-(apurinic or apyrimidinic site) lyase [Rhodocyclaceae bacterium]
MPELPEVEVTRRGLLADLLGRRIAAVEARCTALRYPLPRRLAGLLGKQILRGIDRRGKYLLFRIGQGTLLVHLGMSGSLRLVTAAEPPGRHDHLDLVFGDSTLRLRDPRRFGAVLWIEGDAAAHPLLASLGIEPLSDAFDGAWLRAAARGRALAVKPFIMDSRLIVGVGNIYASESLFRARIDPRTPAGRLSLARCARLAEAIKATLEAALAAGGSTLRDFIHGHGASGCFQQQHGVYGREGEPCRVCGARVRALRLGQRSTFFCPRCQR